MGIDLVEIKKARLFYRNHKKSLASFFSPEEAKYIRRGENPPRTLGFYHGVPLIDQSPSAATPQVFITLYQEPIERESRGDPEELERLVNRHLS